MTKPSSFQRGSFCVTNGVITSNFYNMIKKGMNGNKPSIHAAKPLHERLESCVELAVFNKACSEVGVHNASSVLSR